MEDALEAKDSTEPCTGREENREGVSAGLRGPGTAPRRSLWQQLALTLEPTGRKSRTGTQLVPTAQSRPGVPCRVAPCSSLRWPGRWALAQLRGGSGRERGHSRVGANGLPSGKPCRLPAPPLLSTGDDRLEPWGPADDRPQGMKFLL